MKPLPEKIYHSVTFRCVEFIRPHLRLIVGAALMGVGKFTLPLAFPLAFKYVVDVLLTSPAKLDGPTRAIDHWCVAIANFAGYAATSTIKVEVLSLVMLALYSLMIRLYLYIHTVIVFFGLFISAAMYGVMRWNAANHRANPHLDRLIGEAKH